MKDIGAIAVIDVLCSETVNVLGHYDLMLVSVTLSVLIDNLCSAQRERQLITEPGVFICYCLH